MDTAIRRFRSEAPQLARGKAPRGIRYPAQFRRAAVRLARAHRERDGVLAELAHELGVATPTLHQWLARPAAPRLRPVALEPAAMRAENHPARPVLITAQGVRVEGLDADALIAVLRALA
jgi:transposase-like protein